MDGFARLNFDLMNAPRWQQRTLKAAIGCVGVGVHTGRRVNLTFRPAEHYRHLKSY